MTSDYSLYGGLWIVTESLWRLIAGKIINENYIEIWIIRHLVVTLSIDER